MNNLDAFFKKIDEEKNRLWFKYYHKHRQRVKEGEIRKKELKNGENTTINKKD